MAAAPMAGGGWLAWKQAQQWLDRVNTSSREGFVLPSDAAFDETMGEKGLRFGYTQDHGLPLDIENSLLMRHTAIIGQSGVGKTTLGEYLLWQQTMRGGGWVFIDAKLDEETKNKLAYMAAAVGREDEFYVLNVANPENSNTYNPILQGGPDEVASRLLNLLPASENSPGADYYRQAANHALTVLTGALQEAKHRYHFGDFSILLQSSQAMMALERLTPPGKAKMALQVFLDQFRKRTKEGVTLDTDKIKTVLGGMSGRIALFAQGKFGRVFNTYTPEIDLTDIIVNNRFLYVMLPTMSQDTAALNLGKMVLSDLRTAVANVQGMKKSMRPWPPFKVFADEMGSYVMPGIARLFEQARSAHICMIPAFQSFANLAAVSPEFADIIIGNTWSKVFFKFGSQDSPETAAEILGKTRRFARSISASQSEGTSAQAANMGPQGSNSDSGGFGESWREAEEFRVTPDQLRSLGMGESVVMVGARMFHIRSPMLNFPQEIPDFVPVRHPGVIPKGEFALNLEMRYKEFLMDPGEAAVAKVIEQPVIAPVAPSEPGSVIADLSGVPATDESSADKV
ncbi:MAG: type IV secretory system conjugative DNA transfer family protein [Candidatus Nanopelagicales bacterium]